MKKPTLKQYHDKIESLVDQSYIDNPPKSPPKSMVKSRGIRWGKHAEPALVSLLKEHPNYKSHDVQVRYKPVGGSSCVDVVMQTKTGKTVYIPVVKEVWSATAQVDRLESVYWKWKGNLLKEYNYCFFCALDYKPRLAKTFKKGTVKELIVNEFIQELVDNKIIFNIDTLWDHLNSL